MHCLNSTSKTMSDKLPNIAKKGRCFIIDKINICKKFHLIFGERLDGCHNIKFYWQYPNIKCIVFEWNVQYQIFNAVTKLFCEIYIGFYKNRQLFR